MKETKQENLLDSKDQQDIIKALLDSSYDGIVMLDGQQRVLHVGNALERITGIIPERIKGQNVTDLIHKGIIEKNSVTAMVYQTKKRMSSLLQFRPKDRIILTTANPYFDDDGNISYVLVNIRNISELAALECNIKEFYDDKLYFDKLAKKIDNAGIKDFVFLSDEIAEIIELIISLKDFELNYLITGETGTGKGLFSRTIHNLSPRRHRPFIEINCSAIPADLLEAELFGYTEGAFTGAKKPGQKGLLELADKGTIFFDEIGLMPLHLQSKILKFLDDKNIRRLGASQTIDLDVLIVAATNRDLDADKEDGQFRKDLFYRLNEIGITIPPLRKRREDIPPLIKWFWKKYNKQFGKRVILDEKALRYLSRYQYPGNVRELKNIIKRLVVITRKPVIEEADVIREVPISEKTPSIHEELVPDSFEFSDRVEAYEKELIENAYQEHGSTYSAARALGMKQSTFYRKAKKYAVIG